MGAREGRSLTDRAVELLRDGLRVAEIAARLGCSERTVYRARLECGLAERREPLLSGEARALALALADEECPVGEIAETLGVSREVVRRVTGVKTDVATGREARRMVAQVEAL